MDQNFNKIRKILLSEWDPLGVGDNPKLSDEYDSYIPKIAQLINDNANVGVVNNYLKDVEREIEVSVDDNIRLRASEYLLKSAGRAPAG